MELYVEPGALFNGLSSCHAVDNAFGNCDRTLHIFEKKQIWVGYFVFFQIQLLSDGLLNGLPQRSSSCPQAATYPGCDTGSPPTMHQSPCAAADCPPARVVGSYSVVSAVFELWLVLREFAPEFPTLVLLYHDMVGQLSGDELEELIECQVVICFSLAGSFGSLTCNWFSLRNPNLNFRMRFPNKIKNMIRSPRWRVSNKIRRPFN